MENLAADLHRSARKLIATWNPIHTIASQRAQFCPRSMKAGNNRQHTHEFDPQSVVLKRLPKVEFLRVIHQSDQPNNDQQERDNGDGDGPPAGRSVAHSPLFPEEISAARSRTSGGSDRARRVDASTQIPVMVVRAASSPVSWFVISWTMTTVLSPTPPTDD
jgi:hypothetical protein